MGSGGKAPPFLTSALDGGERSASRPYRFIPGERTPGTYWIGGLNNIIKIEYSRIRVGTCANVIFNILRLSLLLILIC
jgi:hypothetical protein